MAANFCFNCGAKISPNDRFCTNCGQKVGVIAYTNDQGGITIDAPEGSTITISDAMPEEMKEGD